MAIGRTTPSLGLASRKGLFLYKEPSGVRIPDPSLVHPRRPLRDDQLKTRSASSSVHKMDNVKVNNHQSRSSEFTRYKLGSHLTGRSTMRVERAEVIFLPVITVRTPFPLHTS